MQLSVITSFTGLEKTGMELVENGKLKERSMMETETQSTGILIYLKNI